MIDGEFPELRMLSGFTWRISLLGVLSRISLEFVKENRSFANFSRNIFRKIVPTGISECFWKFFQILSRILLEFLQNIYFFIGFFGNSFKQLFSNSFRTSFGNSTRCFVENSPSWFGNVFRGFGNSLRGFFENFFS